MEELGLSFHPESEFFILLIGIDKYSDFSREFNADERSILKAEINNLGTRSFSGLYNAEIIEMGKEGVAIVLYSLSSNVLLNEKKITGGKRTILKNFFPNFSSEEGKNVFSLVESEKKQEFFKKNKKLVGRFIQLLKNLDGGIQIILIFGSFATYSQTSLEERVSLMKKAEALIKENATDLASLLTKEQGKPLKQASQEVRFCAKLMEQVTDLAPQKG